MFGCKVKKKKCNCQIYIEYSCVATDNGAFSAVCRLFDMLSQRNVRKKEQFFSYMQETA